jgi:hypothetical protein
MTANRLCARRSAKIAIRAIRQQARKRVETTGRGSRNAVQDATGDAVKVIEGLVNAKLTELK